MRWIVGVVVAALAAHAVRSRRSGRAHVHACDGCGTTWSHGEDRHGDVAAHTCPRCGRLQWYRRS